jgi:hypothetical protein
MNPIEERLKDSLDAVARTLPPEAVPALRFPARRPVQLRWITPVVAAVAVGAVVVGLRALPDGAPHRDAPPPPATVPSLGPAAAPPRYYVGAMVPNQIAVYDTVTRRRVDKTSIGGETKVAGAGDGRTFFVATERKVYRLRITANGKVGSVAPVPVKFPSGTSPDALAASRDGTRLAMAFQHPIAGSAPDDTTSTIELVDLTAKTTATWRSSGPGTSLSLSFDPAGRTLAFGWQAMQRSGLTSQIRLLDLTSASRDLLAGRVVADRTRTTTPMGPVAFSPDGRHVAAATMTPGRSEAQIVDYPLTPGPRPRVLVNGAPGGASEYFFLGFDPTGTNLLFSGGGYPTSRLANGKVIRLGSSQEADMESTAAW